MEIATPAKDEIGGLPVPSLQDVHKTVVGIRRWTASNGGQKLGFFSFSQFSIHTDQDVRCHFNHVGVPCYSGSVGRGGDKGNPGES
jgi:hypothetical protein